MKTKVINLNPELNYTSLETKTQTLRPYSVEVGTPIALWLKKRGMKKGRYCTACWKQVEIDITEGFCPHQGKGRIERILLPQLFKRTDVKYCTLIDLHYIEASEVNDHVSGISIKLPEDEYADDSLYIPEDPGVVNFVKAEGFRTNKEWIDIMLKMYPKMKKEWVKMYLIRW